MAKLQSAPLSRFLISEPISYPYDYWLLEKNDDLTLSGSVWGIDLIAPSPRAGEWASAEEFRSHYSKTITLWKWVPITSPGVFSPLPRVWVFSGEKPEYIREKRKWTFQSTKPGLALFEQNRPLTWRFRYLPEGLLEISRNSHFTSQLLPRILDTFSKAERAEFESNQQLVGFSSYATGAEAIEPCGVSTWCGESKVECLAYDPVSHRLSLGMPKNSKKQGEKIVLELNTQNLGVSMDGVLKAVVETVDTELSHDFDVIEVVLDKKSSSFYGELQVAIEKRQVEIESFLKMVKGVDVE